MFANTQLIIYTKTTTTNMGRGDKKTAKGKRFKGSFGKSRPHKTVTNKAAIKAS